MSTIVGNSNLRLLWDGLAKERSNHLFLAYESKTGDKKEFTYKEFNNLINKTANFFLSLGVKHGQNVAIQLYNSPECISIAFALAKIGAVAVPLNMQHTLEECEYVVNKCDIDIVICEPDCQYYYTSEAPEYTAGNIIEVSSVYVCHAQGATLYDGMLDFDASIEECSSTLDFDEAIDALDTAMIIFTSGTTSDPKGVEITHANMLFGGYFGDWQCGLTPDDRLLTTMPAFHSNFHTAALMPVLTAGATLIFIEKYSAHKYWNQVLHYKATAIQLVAMMARTMMMQPINENEQNHSVHSAQYYLAISDEEKAAFEKRFNLRLQNCYGSTESICWVLTDTAYGERRWPSVGRVGLGYVVDIVNEFGVNCEPGEVGEVVVHGIPGETLMKGYYHDWGATNRAISSDGRYYTGDKGYQDDNGWFYFVDRKSNMIKRAGENISASEVESVLMDLPHVEEVAVIGVADPIRDMAVKAFIAFKPGYSMTEEEVIDFCHGRLAGYKIPTIIQFVDSLPHTSVGKCAKKLLH